MKKKIFPGFVLLLISLIVVSCVSQKDFDKVQSDLSAAQANVEGLESDLEASQNQIKTLQSDYESLKSDYDSLKSDYDKANSDLSAAQANVEDLESDLEASQSQSEVLQERMGRSKALVESINAIFIPTLTGEIFTLTEAEAVKLLFEWNEKIQATEDPTVEEKFNAFLDASSPVAEDEALMDFFLYVFENIPKILE